MGTLVGRDGGCPVPRGHCRGGRGIEAPAAFTPRPETSRVCPYTRIYTRTCAWGCVDACPGPGSCPAHVAYLSVVSQTPVSWKCFCILPSSTSWRVLKHSDCASVGRPPVPVWLALLAPGGQAQLCCVGVGLCGGPGLEVGDRRAQVAGQSEGAQCRMVGGGQVPGLGAGDGMEWSVGI